MRGAEVDCVRLVRRAAADFLTVTELADTLVRREGLSFREAHAMVSRAVQSSAGDDRPGAIAAVLLNQNPSLRLTRDELERALDPENFIRIRRVIGGPAPEVVAEALSHAREEQARITEWLHAKESLLEAAHRQNRGSQ